jgi:hypothetical protein
MGFWDVLLFNIATVLGPRWIAAAGHNGTSSISLWVLAAVFFFVPGALVINELSSRFPEEGGLYVWSREAFGPFHGFVAGWTYWIYTVFYFPGLLLASASMSAYIILGRGAPSRRTAPFCSGSRWPASRRRGAQHHRPQHRQVAAERRRRRHLSAAAHAGRRRRNRLLSPRLRTHFTVANMMPTWNWDTVNFWSQIAFAFTGLELVSAMSEEVRDPRRTLPRAVFGAGALIALMYIAGTFAILALVPAADLDPRAASFTPSPSARSRCASASSASSPPSSSPRATPAASAAPWPASRACPSSSASTAICPPPSAKSIPAGRRPTSPSSCRPLSPAPSCSAARSTNHARRLSKAHRRRHHSLLHSLPLHVRRGHQARRPQRPRRRTRTPSSSPAAIPGVWICGSLGLPRRPRRHSRLPRPSRRLRQQARLSSSSRRRFRLRVRTSTTSHVRTTAAST